MRIAVAALSLALGLQTSDAAPVIELPPPETGADHSLERAIAARRSHRRLATTPLSREEIGQLLWAAQGITSARGLRTAPSAGARYPLELYVLLPDGVYGYLPRRHALIRVATRDLRAVMWKLAYAQPWLAEAPAIFLFTGVYQRTAARYGRRAQRYVHIEVGHAAQNLLLQATALGLGGVGVGAFADREVQQTLGLPRAHEPLYAIPIGHLRR
jgi:SagB-type dehydrogenase family enzyme